MFEIAEPIAAVTPDISRATQPDAYTDVNTQLSGGNHGEDALLGEAKKLEGDVSPFPNRVTKQIAGETIDR
jgi:hypothetical protein